MKFLQRRHSLAQLSGFTFLEIVITLAIFIAVLTASVPLAVSWNQTLKKTNAHGLLKTAISSARAVAQVNRFSSQDLESAAALCQNNDAIFVREASADGPASCEGNGQIRWQSDWTPGADVLLFEQRTNTWQPLQCICLRSSGLSTLEGDCGDCSRVNAVRIQVGDEYVEHKSL